MPEAAKKTIARYRRNMKRMGLVRVEIQVRKEDAPLVRDVAGALVDPTRETQTRAFLRERFPERQTKGLKALLAEAPLDGVDLSRRRDSGRAVRL